MGRLHVARKRTILQGFQTRGFQNELPQKVSGDARTRGEPLSWGRSE